MPAPSYTVHLVQHPDQLPPVLESICRAGRVGLDTEFMREGRYFAKLCLVQLVAGEDIWLIDPLSAGELDALWTALLRDDLEIVLHSGWQDMEILHQQTGRVPPHLLDVQIMAGFAGYGYPLAYHGLVHAVTKVHLHKGATFTYWDKRPLTKDQLEYAADDVRYLLPVAERLEQKLSALGREDAARWPGFDRRRCAQEETRWQYRPERMVFDPQEELLSMGRTAERMTGAQRTLLRELLSWRERAARLSDRPLNSVAKLETLSTLARRPPASLADLAHARGLAVFRDKSAQQDLLATIAQAKTLPPTEWQRPDRPEELPRACAPLVDFLTAALHLWSENVEIAPELLARPKDISAWLVDQKTGQPSENGALLVRSRLSEGWRAGLVGDMLKKLLAGEWTLTPTPDGPDGWPGLELKPTVTVEKSKGSL